MYLYIPEFIREPSPRSSRSAPVPDDARIGLALSGGGIRAAVFHLGVLKRLAELGLLENIRHLSTVSGASLAAALIYAKNGGCFPDSAAYLDQVLPVVRETILRHDIQDRALMSLTVRPWNWRRKANLLAEAVEQLWGVKGAVRDLPADPLWSINCTTFETGKSFRITPLAMGDYKVGYVKNPAVSIAEAAAASAGFPVLIGPYRLSSDSGRMRGGSPGQTAPGGRPLHLWDGGVYDNLGLEALYKIAENGHLTGELNYLIISSASSESGRVKRNFFSPVRNLKRLLDITMDQVNSLRSRDVTDYFSRTGKGCYLRIGTVTRSWEENGGKGPRQSRREDDRQTGGGNDRQTGGENSCQTGRGNSWQSGGALSPQEVSFVKHYPTTLSSPTPGDFDLILRHGYEVARQGLAVKNQR